MQEWNMIQAYPPSPAPFYSYSLYFYAQFFYIIYLIYFPVEIQTVLAPVSFLSHIKIQKKSHYKDTQPLWIY